MEKEKRGLGILEKKAIVYLCVILSQCDSSRNGCRKYPRTKIK